MDTAMYADIVLQKQMGLPKHILSIYIYWMQRDTICKDRCERTRTHSRSQIHAYHIHTRTRTHTHTHTHAGMHG